MQFDEPVKLAKLKLRSEADASESPEGQLSEEAEPKCSTPSEAVARAEPCGQYEIVSLIGQGGMGSVFRARHKQLGKEFAVKVIHPELLDSDFATRRFEQEAIAAGTLTHANLVAVYEHGKTVSGSSYLVMDLIEGTSLADLFHKEGFLDAKRAIDLFVQISEAVAHAHMKGVIHRDLKPSNILVKRELDNTEIVKVFDFGIAKIFGKSESDPSFTQESEVFGSPSYMSPEQCLGLSVDVRSDVYSLGCIMYEALTGVCAFSGANPIETLMMQINDEPPDLDQVAPDHGIPDSLKDIVLNALEKDPERRYQNMEELLVDLGRARDRQSIVRTRMKKASAASPRPLRSRVLRAASAAVCIALVIDCALLGEGYRLFRARQAEQSKVSAAAGLLSTGSSAAVLPHKNLFQFVDKHKKVLFQCTAASMAGAFARAAALHADLRGADLSGQRLENIQVGDVNLKGADFSNCALINFHVACPHVQDADFSNAVFEGVWICFSDLSGAKFHNAKLLEKSDSKTFSCNNLSNADFSGASLRQAEFGQSRLTGANLREADLTGADFRHASMAGADFSGAILNGADLNHAILTDAKFTNADLRQSKTEGAVGADFSQARSLP